MPAPIANIDVVGQTTGAPPMLVSFSAAASSAVTSGATLDTYEWDFGDGDTFSSTTPTASHIFTDVGVFTVLLTVTDSDSATSTTSAHITVVRHAPVIAEVAGEHRAEVWYDYSAFAIAEECTLEEAITALSEATFILSELTEGQIHGERCWRDDYRAPVTNRIDLKHFPVKNVDVVYLKHDCDSTLTEVEFCMLSSRTISIKNASRAGIYPGTGFAWQGGTHGDATYRSCGCDARYVVEYTQGSTLVPGSGRAAAALAREYVKASQGLACRLPERITSVTRQGMSWTILDPQDFLTRGLTGVSVVDHWLSAARRHTNGLMMTDPLNGVLAETTALDCRTWQPFDVDSSAGSDNSAGYYPIEVTTNDVFRGEPFDLTQAGEPWILTSAIAHVRETMSSSSPLLLDLTVTIDSNTGRVTVGEGDLMNVAPGTYYWDLQATDATGPLTILWGEFVVKPEVSS